MTTDRAGAMVHRLAIALALACLSYALWIHFAVLVSATPQTYRECAITLSTDLIAHGGDPFALQNQPVFINVYGVTYNLLAWPLMRLSSSAFLVHRALSAFFVFGCAGMVFWVLRYRAVRPTLAFIGAVLLYVELSARWTDLRPFGVPLSITARPDAMGLFLFLASFLWPFKANFSRKSLAIAAALSIAAFFTKPYFAFGLPIVALYLFLFRSKITGLAYGAIGLGTLAALIVLVTLRYECYAANIITGNRAAAGAKVPMHLLRQLTQYAISLPGTIAMLLVMFSSRRTFNAGQQPNSAWRSPLFTTDVDYFVFALACCTTVFCVLLGLHGGNSMLYAYQFISPWLLIVVFSYIGTARGQWTLIPPALIALDLTLFLVTRPPIPSSHQDVWNEWRAVIQPYQTVYAPPPLAWILQNQGKRVYDTGLSEYFSYSAIGSVYPSNAVLQAKYDSYVADVAKQVVNERFDLIILPYDGDQPLFCFVPTDHLAAHYKPVGRMDLPMDWEPNYHGVLFERIDRSASR